MKTDERFTRDFHNSNKYVNLVAYWLTRQGINARILPYMLRPDVSLRNEYSDMGDIEIIMKVEVKHRGIEFTSTNDYPYRTILIDEVYKLDKKTKDLYAYAILNKSANVCCLIMKTTQRYWNKIKKFDRDAGEIREFYEIPKEYGIFMSIDL